MSLKKLYRDYLLESIIILILVFGIVTFWCLNLELKDKLSSSVLWLTAWAVIYYAIETKQLRLVSLSQLRVQKETMKNEFLPIIYPFSGMMQGQLLRLNLVNKGKSLAKHVEIMVQGRIKFKVASLSESLPEEDRFEWRDERISELTANQRIKIIDIEILYKDIYNRKYRTTGVRFTRDEPEPGNRFQLDRSNWEFKRKYKQN